MAIHDLIISLESLEPSQMIVCLVKTLKLLSTMRPHISNQTCQVMFFKFIMKFESQSVSWLDSVGRSMACSASLTIHQIIINLTFGDLLQNVKTQVCANFGRHDMVMAMHDLIIWLESLEPSQMIVCLVKTFKLLCTTMYPHIYI